MEASRGRENLWIYVDRGEVKGDQKEKRTGGVAGGGHDQSDYRGAGSRKILLFWS